MKIKIFILLVFILVIFLVFMGCRQTRPRQIVWKEFSSVRGVFSVLFPGKPIERTKAVNTPAGTINVHLFTLKQRLLKKPVTMLFL